MGIHTMNISIYFPNYCHVPLHPKPSLCKPSSSIAMYPPLISEAKFIKRTAEKSTHVRWSSQQFLPPWWVREFPTHVWGHWRYIPRTIPLYPKCIPIHPVVSISISSTAQRCPHPLDFPSKSSSIPLSFLLNPLKSPWTPINLTKAQLNPTQCPLSPMKSPFNPMKWLLNVHQSH